MKVALLSALIFMATGITLGAFGAHGLRDYFIGREEEIWKTAVFYQLISALGLLGLVLLEKNQLTSSKISKLASRAMSLGILIFSGSLYLLVLCRVGWLGAITPIGGALLIGSWALLAWGTWRYKV